MNDRRAIPVTVSGMNGYVIQRIREPMTMKRIVVESPYASHPNGRHAGAAYALECMRDCLARGEAPIASHLLYTIVLDDTSEEQRRLGIDAGFAWQAVADVVALYIDYGETESMTKAAMIAESLGIRIERRKIGV